MHSTQFLKFLAAGFLITTLFSCDTSNDNLSGSGTNFTELPDAFKNFRSGIDVYLDGQFVVIECDGVPDHGSPYFSDNRYEAYNGSNSQFNLNPNRISEQDFVFRIPLNPAEASKHESTPMGAIGVSLNGVPFYNQYAAQQAALTNEINSFDQYNGHPQNTGQYHYHIEPKALTAEEGSDALLGFLLDGFPVYGPMEDGKTVSNNDLDEYHGHFHATPEYPDGIYHYHTTDQDPYINGNGFYGTAGTVSN